MIIRYEASWPEQVQVVDSEFDQSGWAYGGTDDFEEEHDGREDGADRERNGHETDTSLAMGSRAAWRHMSF